MREVETDVSAFYSGNLETDISNFLLGQLASDINGVGNVDLLDSPVVEHNLNAFIFSNHTQR